jgi:hypothetical protein
VVGAVFREHAHLGYGAILLRWADSAKLSLLPKLGPMGVGASAKCLIPSAPPLRTPGMRMSRFSDQGLRSVQ